MPKDVAEEVAALDLAAAGEAMHAFASRAFPICRSITGDGVRQTLELIRQELGEAAGRLEIHEVPTGTPVFDWSVPREWNLREAYLLGPSGERVVDAANHSLHVLNYSVPIRRKLPLAELREHLFSLPAQPDRIPYRTSYYRETWGFCLPHRLLEALPEGDYEAVIDSRLDDGSLTYGEVFLPGEEEREVLVSAHLCHPSLANDNLSGLAVASRLARHLATCRRRYGYRILFIPGTIGSITWLARNPDAAQRVAHGLVAANLGDPGPFHYKRSRRGDTAIDRAVRAVLGSRGESFEILDFEPFGYDERQFCSPGFDLAVGSLTRTPWGRYPEYHTSGDDLELIRPEALAASLQVYLQVMSVLEGDRAYLNLNPHCEPQLGRRGLYRSIGGSEDGRERELALLWTLNFSDGEHSLLQIAERSKMPFALIRQAADLLLDADLLREAVSEEADS